MHLFAKPVTKSLCRTQLVNVSKPAVGNLAAMLLTGEWRLSIVQMLHRMVNLAQYVVDSFRSLLPHNGLDDCSTVTSVITKESVPFWDSVNIFEQKD